MGECWLVRWNFTTPLIGSKTFTGQHWLDEYFFDLHSNWISLVDFSSSLTNCRHIYSDVEDLTIDIILILNVYSLNWYVNYTLEVYLLIIMLFVDYRFWSVRYSVAVTCTGGSIYPKIDSIDIVVDIDIDWSKCNKIHTSVSVSLLRGGGFINESTESVTVGPLSMPRFRCKKRWFSWYFPHKVP